MQVNTHLQNEELPIGIIIGKEDYRISLADGVKLLAQLDGAVRIAQQYVMFKKKRRGRPRKKFVV